MNSARGVAKVERKDQKNQTDCDQDDQEPRSAHDLISSAVESVLGLLTVGNSRILGWLQKLYFRQRLPDPNRLNVYILDFEEAFGVAPLPPVSAPNGEHELPLR